MVRGDAPSTAQPVQARSGRTRHRRQVAPSRRWRRSSASVGSPASHSWPWVSMGVRGGTRSSGRRRMCDRRQAVIGSRHGQEERDGGDGCGGPPVRRPREPEGSTPGAPLPRGQVRAHRGDGRRGRGRRRQPCSPPRRRDLLHVLARHGRARGRRGVRRPARSRPWPRSPRLRRPRGRQLRDGRRRLTPSSAPGPAPSSPSDPARP